MGLVISLFASYRANDPVFWELVTWFFRMRKNKTKHLVAKRPRLVTPKSEYELITKLPNRLTIRREIETEDLFYFKPSDRNLGELNLNKLNSPYIQRAGFSVVVDGDEFIVFPEERVLSI